MSLFNAIRILLVGTLALCVLNLWLFSSGGSDFNLYAAILNGVTVVPLAWAYYQKRHFR